MTTKRAPADRYKRKMGYMLPNNDGTYDISVSNTRGSVLLTVGKKISFKEAILHFKEREFPDVILVLQRDG